VISQTLIIRESFILFGGNELVSGIILCFWLVWVGIGSMIFTKLKLKIEAMKIYSLMLCLLNFFIVFSILFIRLAPKIFSLPFGEVIPLDKTFYIAIIDLAPACLIFGGLFPAAAKILAPQEVYLLDAIGSFLGGLMISFVLIQILPPLGILLIVMFLLTSCALIIVNKAKLLFLSCLILLVFIKINNIELFFRKLQMGNQDIIGLKDSKYGLIAVTKTGAQVNFYINGLYDFSYPDQYTSEDAVHYALLLHQAPKKVLLVGGGIGNCITQIFKHPSVAEITYLELDPLLFEMGEKYIGENLKKVERLNIIFGDARFFIKNTRDKYDVVIINLPDPTNAQLNRFYTKEFFVETKRIINHDGILSVRIAAPPDIISPFFGQLLSAVYNSLHYSFKHILSLPAAKTTFIANEKAIALDDVVDILKMRIRERNLDLQYVNEYFFDYNLSDEKLSYLRERINASKVVINTDLKPICYYFSTILWGGLTTENLKKIFVKLFDLKPIFFLLPLILIFLFFRHHSIIYLAVFSMGASQISAEFIMIILFQVFYGYLYSWIGIIIAFFMLGLASGTLFYLKSPFFKNVKTSVLANLQIIMGFYFIIIILLSLAKLPMANFIIPVLILGAGFLGGMHFPTSITILKREKAGLVYSVDLIGASLGVLVTSMIFIPILGIVFTLFIFLLLNLIIGFGLKTI